MHLLCHETKITNFRKSLLRNDLRHLPFPGSVVVLNSGWSHGYLSAYYVRG